MSRTFEWGRDCGSTLSPGDAAREALDGTRPGGGEWRGVARSGALRRYAEEYLAAWPFEQAPPANLVEGMVREMEAAWLVALRDDRP